MNDNYPTNGGRSILPANRLTNADVRAIVEASLEILGRWFALETIEDVGVLGGSGRYVVIRQFEGPVIGNFILLRDDVGLDQSGLVVLLENGQNGAPEYLGVFGPYQKPFRPSRTVLKLA